MVAPPHRQKLVLMSEINKGPADVDHQRPRSQDGACAVTQSFSLSKKPESKVGEWQSAHLNKRRVSCMKCASAVRIKKYPGYVIWSSVNYLNMRLSAAGDRTYVPPLPLWQLQLCTDGLQSSLQKRREHERLQQLQAHIYCWTEPSADLGAEISWAAWTLKNRRVLASVF